MAVQQYSLIESGDDSHPIAIRLPPAQDNSNCREADQPLTTSDKLCLVLLGFLLVSFWIGDITSSVSFFQNQGEYDVEIRHISGLNTTSSVVNTDITFVITARNPHQHRFHELIMYVDLFDDNIGAGVIPLDSFNSTPFSIVISSGPWTLNSHTKAVLANSAEDLPLSVTAYATIEASFGFDFKLDCKMTLDLTRTNGSQLTYHRCEYVP